MVVTKTKPVRVRIPPSPTGFAHVGTAYVALFNFAFARHSGGTVVLRLEDTDVKRYLPEAEAALYEGLSWLGISWDEGPDKGGKFAPYKQSERLEIYQQKAKALVSGGQAYEKDGAIYLKSVGRDIYWQDMVRGKISFARDSAQLQDFVILKSDGYPVYNFAVVVDDIAMEISHVIRGEDHISNTPRQLALYQVFDASPPRFAHISLLRNPQRQKLSKRKNPVDLRFYRDQGYLPEALVNFLCLLGWSHPAGKEIFSLDEFVEVFDLSRVKTTAPVFDMAKLLWINGEYIRRTQNSKLKTQIWEFFGKEYPQDLVEQTIPLVKQRMKTLEEYESLAGFFFDKPAVAKNLLAGEADKHLAAGLEVIEKSDWTIDTLQKELLLAVQRNKFKTGDFFMSLRVALTGETVTPPVVESMVLLGREETLTRIRSAVSLV